MFDISNLDLEKAGYSPEEVKCFLSVAANMLFPNTSKKLTAKEKKAGKKRNPDPNRVHRSEYMEYYTSFRPDGYIDSYKRLNFAKAARRSIDQGLEAGKFYTCLHWLEYFSGPKSIKFAAYLASQQYGRSHSYANLLMLRYRPVSHFWYAYRNFFTGGLFTMRYVTYHFSGFLQLSARYLESFSKAGTDKRKFWMPPKWQTITGPLPPKPEMPEEAQKMVHQMSQTLENEYPKYLKIQRG